MSRPSSCALCASLLDEHALPEEIDGVRYWLCRPCVSESAGSGRYSFSDGAASGRGVGYGNAWIGTGSGGRQSALRGGR